MSYLGVEMLRTGGSVAEGVVCEAATIGGLPLHSTTPRA